MPAWAWAPSERTASALTPALVAFAASSSSRCVHQRRIASSVSSAFGTNAEPTIGGKWRTWATTRLAPVSLQSLTASSNALAEMSEKSVARRMGLDMVFHSFQEKEKGRPPQEAAPLR